MDADNQGDCYITKKQLQHFEEVLKEKREILRSQRQSSAKALQKYSNASEVDDALMHSQEVEREIKEINNALKRIQDGSYGYCQKSGDEIGIKRLEVTPTAKYCLEVQEDFDKKKIFAQNSSDH